MNIGSITLRLLLAVALGGIIGIERETSHKPAGLRTNILICVSSAMMMIVGGIITGKDVGQDVTRIAAGVITGVGFLGAGAIIQSRGTVHGLTTASVIWAVAGLGIAVGAGYYLIALVFTLIIVLVLVLLRRVDHILYERSEKNHRPDR